MPFEYPTPPYVFEQQEWEEKLEKSCALSGNKWGPPLESTHPRSSPPLKKRVSAPICSPIKPIRPPPKLKKRGKVKVNIGKRGQWSNDALKLAKEATNNGHPYTEVCVEYKIPWLFLRDHMTWKTNQGN